MSRHAAAEALASGAANSPSATCPTCKKAGFFRRSCFSNDYVCIVRSEHPAIGERLTLTPYLRRQPRRGEPRRPRAPAGAGAAERGVERRVMAGAVPLHEPAAPHRAPRTWSPPCHGTWPTSACATATSASSSRRSKSPAWRSTSSGTGASTRTRPTSGSAARCRPSSGAVAVAERGSGFVPPQGFPRWLRTHRTGTLAGMTTGRFPSA